MNRQLTRQVFYDTKRKRWPRIKIASVIIGLAFFVIYGILIGSILVNPFLPNLGLAPFHNLPQKAHITSITGKSVQEQHEQIFQRSKQQLLTHQQGVVTHATSSKKSTDRVIGYYVNWDDTSFSSLEQNAQDLTTLAPEWLHLSSVGGNLVEDNPVKTQRVLDYLQSQHLQLELLPLINNFSNSLQDWDTNMIGELLKSPTAQETLINQIQNYLTMHHFQGITIDFEALPDGSQPAFVEFIQRLTQQLHQQNLIVAVNVPMADESFDYQNLATATDLIIVMAYDENASSDPPGPIADQQWFIDKISDRLQDIPTNKLIISLGNYGYDWPDKGAGEGITYQEALTAARDGGEPIAFDKDTMNPMFDYYDSQNRHHTIWYLDSITIFNQLHFLQTIHPAGIALWRLGSEDPQAWRAIEDRSRLGQTTVNNLKTLTYGYDIDYEGDGEILQVTQLPQDGAREISYSAAQMITNEHIIQFPLPYVINRWGLGNADTKKIALTFDDGPDPHYTSTILEILKKYHVPATFFVIGEHADANPELLKKIVADGNELGNHTFTHPNIALISPKQLALEINATERLFESRLGQHALFFRPPYAEDIEPERPDEVAPLLESSQMGYYTVGMRIDPSDWQNPGVQTIVNRVIKGAQEQVGHIVLLHDSGGDRSQTIAALPEIIEQLKSQGFQLVTVSDLIGKKTSDVMPLVTTSDRLISVTNSFSFTVLAWIVSVLKGVGLIAIVIGLLRLLILGFMAIYQTIQSRQVTKTINYQPTVTILVPAYNEVGVIKKTIQSLLKSHYRHLRVVVVDDGSIDGTTAVIEKNFSHNPNLQLITQSNQGKAAALNAGLAVAKSEIIVVVDADTQIQPEAIGYLANHFYDPDVIAVAGNAKVGNRINLLTRWQALEYITSQNLERRAFSFVNCTTIVPGAIGAWRRQALQENGGFTNDTLAEDADLTVRLLRNGSKIVYEPRAIGLTEAPDTLDAFLRQRYRWSLGILQMLWKHRSALFQKPRLLGWFALPSLWFFQIIFALAAPALDLWLLLTLIWTILQAHAHPDSYSTFTLLHVLFYYAIFLSFDYIIAIVSFYMEKNEDYGLLTGLFFQRLFYRQLIYLVISRAIMTALRGSGAEWDKLERKGTV